MFPNILQYSRRKTPVLASLFNNATVLKVYNLNWKRLDQMCFLAVNIAKCLRTAFFIEHLWWLLLKMSYWTPPQGFFYLNECLWNFKFLPWEVYASMVIHGQYIFITYYSAGRERKNLQQLIKITNLTKIKQKFISTTWPQWLTLKNKVIHQQISLYPKSFLVTLKFSSLFIMKSLLNVSLYTLIVFILHVVYLYKTTNSWYKCL